MPERSFLQAAAGRMLRRWPRVQAQSLTGLDVIYRAALFPFRRMRVRGAAGDDAALVARTDACNEAAERYFATFPDPAFLLDKPFSEPARFGRHLIDAGVLVDAMRLRPGDTVAELGAGSGWLSHLLNRFGCATIAIDVAPTAVALARRLFERDPRTNWTLEPRFVAYDGHRLPLADASCDRVVINDAFHHVPNQRELLTEMHRVLRADGMVAMSEPGRGHAGAAHSVEEAARGVLENELVLEDLAAMARDCGFGEVNVVAASPIARREIPATELGAFMGGKGFAAYWKAFCSGLEQHHYLLLYKGSSQPTTSRPATLTARIDVVNPRGPVTMAAGEPAAVTLRIANIGNTRWLAAAGPEGGWTRVGAHLHHRPDRQLVDFDWCRADLPADVLPGGQVNVTLALPAVGVAGDYLVTVDLVVEGLTWFADRGSMPALLTMNVRRS